MFGDEDDGHKILSPKVGRAGSGIYKYIIYIFGDGCGPIQELVPLHVFSNFEHK